jgi:hypothetical protein
MDEDRIPEGIVIYVAYELYFMSSRFVFVGT